LTDGGIGLPFICSAVVAELQKYMWRRSQIPAAATIAHRFHPCTENCLYGRDQD
jgi:hypothetical protein